MLRKLKTYSALMITSLMGIQAVQAQDAPQAVASPEPAKVERIEVTGSHIKRVDVEGVAPVVTISRKEIDKSGMNSVSDVIRNNGVSSFGSAREQSGSASAGNAEVNLRGLGADNTLVLLNGQRLPTDAITGTVDLNLIPLAAVERIEILKDGASALYGSDALGGVVNIITRKDFKGTQLGITQTVPTVPGGKQTNLSAINGVNTEKLNLVTVLNYRYNQAVQSKDRSWSSPRYSNLGNPGSYRNSGGTWNADPACPPGNVKHTPNGDYCTFKYSDYSTEIPSISQVAGLVDGTYDLNSNVKLMARLGATHRLVKWSYAPAPGVFSIPGSVADTLGPGGTPLPGVTPGQPLQVQYRLSELGTRDTENTINSYNLLVGTNLQLPRDWQLDVFATNNVVSGSNKGVNGYGLTDGLTDLVTSGAYNPFAPAGTKGNLDSIRYVPTEDTSSRLTGAEVRASGEILQTAAGPVALAVGSLFNYQNYSDVFDAQSVADNVFGNAGSSGAGHRYTQAVYAEIADPIIAKILEIQLAGRFDHYSDFGSTFNPKIGLMAHPTKNLLLRASVGTGFRAPLMQELYAASSMGYATFIDQVACNNERALGGATPSCEAQQYLVTNKGNPGLKEETSIAYNVGAIYEPTNHLSFSTDWFLTQINNVPGIDFGDMTIAEANGSNIAATGVTVNRDSNGYIDPNTGIVAPLQNLSRQEVSGIDFGVAYNFSKVRLATEQSQLLLYKNEGFPGAGYKDKLGWNGNPAWRNTTSATYTPIEHHDLTFTANTIARQQTLDKNGHISRFTSLDLAYEFKAKDWSFSFAVRNILGTTPPVDSSNPTAPVNYALYDPNIRQFIFGLKKNL